jgi:hypothetical protein
VAATVTTFLQRANARNYANGTVISDLTTLGFLLVALATAITLPGLRRSVRSRGQKAHTDTNRADGVVLPNEAG